MLQAASIKVIIADTTFIVRKGLKWIVLENSEFEFVKEVSDNESLRNALIDCAVDVLIVDHCCDDCFSLTAINNIMLDFPKLKVLVISHEKNAVEIKKIIGIGVKNYLLKDCGEREIIDAIQCCARGEKYFCGQIIDILLEKEVSNKSKCETGGITEREIDIIKELASGKRPNEIADLPNISYHTVITHKKNVYRKLDINHSIELMQYALKTGIIS